MQARWIEGKTIAKVDQTASINTTERQFQDVTQITFTDGSRVQFHIQETEDLMSGVELLYYKKGE